MNLDPKLYATRGYYPSKMSTFSVATRGFSFRRFKEYGIRLLSYITNIFAEQSIVHTPIELKSEIL